PPYRILEAWGCASAWLLRTFRFWAFGGAVVACRERSSLGQLELNAAIAPIGVLVPAGVDRLDFTQPGSDKARRPDALVDQIPHHRDCARRRQIPVRLELAYDDRPHVSVTVTVSRSRPPNASSWIR